MKDHATPSQFYSLAPFYPTLEHELLSVELEVVEPIAQSVVLLKERVTGLQLVPVFVKRCVNHCDVESDQCGSTLEWGTRRDFRMNFFQSRAYVSGATDHQVLEC